MRPRWTGHARLLVAGTVALLGALVLLLPATPVGDVLNLPSSTVVRPQAGDGSVLGTVGRVLSIRSDGRRTGRPARAPTMPDENRHSPPTVSVGPSFTNGIVMDAPVLIGDIVLPWRYRISARLGEALDEGSVHAGVADWDDHVGSRWASEFAGYTTARTATVDGRSTIFLEESCEGLTNANTYIFTDGGLALRRYGALGTMVKEVDIGLCPRLRLPEEIRRAVRHEVGHVIGLGHLCDPGDPCFRSGMAAGGSVGCRTMYWQARICQSGLDAGDLEGLRTLYPTIRPLAGPSREETAARVSFAMFHDGASAMSVVMAVDGPQVAAPAAAALAARSGGSFLLGRADPEQCLGSVARAEVNRSLAHRGTLVLVGDWPAEACRRLALDWNLTVRLVQVTDPVAAALTMADLGPRSAQVIVTSRGEDAVQPSGDAVPAASLAGWAGAPLLLTGPDGLAPEVQKWLDRAAPDSATIVGGPAVVGVGVEIALAERGVAVRRVQGADRVDTALEVAGVMREAGAEAAVIAAAGAASDGLGAAVVAATKGAAVLLSPAEVDPRLTTWLAGTRPREGWSVGGPAVLPPAMLAVYSQSVG